MTDGEMVLLRDGGWIRYWERFLPASEAERLFAVLRDGVARVSALSVVHEQLYEAGTRDPLTDGLLIIRAMLGMTGTAATAGFGAVPRETATACWATPPRSSSTRAPA